MTARFLLKGALFVLIPCLVIELAIRLLLPTAFSGLDTMMDFYQPVERRIERHGMDYLFLGSSRVAAAIDEATFSRVASEASGTRAVAHNAGQGYSTLMIHYLALRRMLEKDPARLQGVTVFVEAPRGLPNFETWEGEWALSQWPELLSPVLTAQDVVPFWQQSANAFEQKVSVTAGSFLLTVRFWKFIRLKASDVVDGTAGAVLTPERLRAGNETVDLAKKGGIRNDKRGADAVRQMAQMQLQSYAEGLVPLSDWDATVLKDVVDLVHQSGGHVVFFDLPISSVNRALFESDVYRANRELFARWADENGFVVLQAPFQHTDDDFPDLMHLRASRAPAFTEALARTYLEQAAGRTLARAAAE